MVYAITLVAAKMEHYRNRMLADPRVRAQLAARKKALQEQQAAIAARRMPGMQGTF